MHSLIRNSILCLALSALLPAHGAGTNMLSTNNVSGSTGWYTSPGTWKTNNGAGVPIGSAVVNPVAGNTYTLIQGGGNPGIGNNLGETRTRNVYTSGSPATVTFPGDSLTLSTNTEIRFKQIAAGNVSTMNFPGVGGNPGLILNGGMLNAGDPAVFPITGLIQAVPGSQSYLCPGNNDLAATDTTRGFNISAAIVGSGDLCIVEGTTNTPVAILSTSNTYSGTWLVKAGRLRGTGSASLGTNSSFVINPGYTLPVPPFDASSSVAVAGPAVLEPVYDLNSAGTLVLTNGGKMRLHQNCAFTAVRIHDGLGADTNLSAGTHFFTELVANCPNNFDPAGSGAITVQPYGALPPLGPIITTQPAQQSVYAGHTAHFGVVASDNGAPPLTYQWQRYGTNLLNGGNISGATSATLTVSAVAAADATGYNVIVANTVGPVTSSNAQLTIVAPSGEAYEAAVIAANASAFYQLNETGDPSTNSAVIDFAGGFNGTYGTAVQNGFNSIAGPLSTDGLPGFSLGNAGAQFANASLTSRITVTPWNLNTNALTITAWINPSSAQNPSEGLVFCRGSNTVAGLCFANGLDGGGNADVGYNWNNEFEASSWLSGLVPPVAQWSLVALVVTPTNATIHLMNTNGIQSATHLYPHIIQSFAGTTTIGDDSGGASGNRVFNGRMDDVAVFNYPLSKTQLFTLFTNASQVTSYAPVLATQPTNETLYAGQTALFTVTAGGSDPLTYQWQSGPSGGPYTNVVDAGRISGANSQTLTLANVNSGDALDYLVTLSNAAGSVTSVVATLNVLATSPAENITMLVNQPAPADWETGASWSDGNPASVSAASKPGSTYELLATGGLNTRMRSPQNPRTAVFPGNMLTMDGNAIWTNNPGTNGNISELRFKQPNPGKVVFPKLVMNGGQLDTGNDGIVEVAGEIDILTNTPFYNDSGADRGYLISAWLTGSGSIEYHGYNQASFLSNYVNNLNIAGTSNTFSGKWNVVFGTLLGTGTNSLGTNDIQIASNGALETTYDINNPGANLLVSGGRVYLHQNDTFRSVIVNGLGLAPGTYTFTQLNSAYPTNFPAAWMPQIGVTNFTSGSGSITVLVQAGPVITLNPVSQTLYAGQNAQFSGAATGNPPLTYQWRAGVTGSGIYTNVVDGGNISGATSNVLSVTSIAAGNAGDYRLVVNNSGGSATSSVATLTVLATSPPENLTLDFGGAPIVQPQGGSWDTLNNWSDGQAASISAVQKPGSTYEVVAGARLRPPTNSAVLTFPGNVLTIDGTGILVNNNDASIGELRFKHNSAGTVFFKKLVMNGGQLDQGDNSLVTITGEIDILTNTPIYVDSAAGQDRSYQIDAWLTGSGTIEWREFGNSFAGNLFITGTSNSFNGKWHIAQGVLLGGGTNSLGTNDIIVDANGAVETLYDVNSPGANVVLNGQMFLHQTNTFRSLQIGNIGLCPGTYSAAFLTGAYTNFPAAWPQQIGSGFSTASGQITVLAAGRTTMFVSHAGPNVTLEWAPCWKLIEAPTVNGPWATNNLATPPFTFVPTADAKFYGLAPQ